MRIFGARLRRAVVNGAFALAGLLCAAHPAAAQSALPPALGIGLEGVDYAYPVQWLDLTLEGQALRTAYMDVAPTTTPNGKAIVLLHGKSFSGDYWGPTIAKLASLGYRVVVPDQIGFGKSSKPDLRYSFDLLARNTKALLDHLGIAEAAILGHSFGGMLAVYFARDYPELTRVLILENPIGLEDYRSAIPPQPLETLFKTEMSQTPESFRSFLKVFFVGWPPAAERTAEIFSRVLKSPEYPRYAMASALTYQMMFDEPIRHEYPLLKMPVLLIIGQSDRSVFFSSLCRARSRKTTRQLAAARPPGSQRPPRRKARRDRRRRPCLACRKAGRIPGRDRRISEDAVFDAIIGQSIKAERPHAVKGRRADRARTVQRRRRRFAE